MCKVNMQSLADCKTALIRSGYSPIGTSSTYHRNGTRLIWTRDTDTAEIILNLETGVFEIRHGNAT